MGRVRGVWWLLGFVLLSACDSSGGAAGDVTRPGDSACVPDCFGRACGDDGCGGACGPACPDGETCGAEGLCVPAGCAPACGTWVCGLDPVCGTASCGVCAGPNDACVAGVCQCVPQCTGRCCGSDGCGGLCPDTCAAGGQTCSPSTCLCEGACAPRSCTDLGLACGPGDNGCGLPLDCGPCDGGLTCVDGACADGCEGGLTLCDERCVDTTTDLEHCGGCGRPCDPGEVCESRACVAGADCRETPCTGLTYCDLATGFCAAGCVEDAQCPLHETCERASHTCTCAAGFHRCGGACVSDGAVTSCGTRCESCPDDLHGSPTCSAGSCGLTCDGGYRLCGGACAACPANASATTCDGAACVATACTAPFKACGGACATCPANATQTTCDGTSCEATDCTAGLEACGGVCATCPANATSTGCEGNACVALDCSGSLAACGGACVTCPAHATATGCEGAVCVATSCEGTREACDGLCADCPAGVEHVGCRGGECVLAGCPVDQHLCADDCCDWRLSAMEEGSRPAIAVGPDGVPQLAYLETWMRGRTLRKMVRHGRWTGSAWTFTTAAEDISYYREDVDLAVDASNRPHICFSDEEDDTLYYATKTATTWSVRAVSASPARVVACAIAVDAAGKPHVSYYDMEDEHFHYATLSGATWTREDVAAGGYERGSSIAVSPDGVAHIAYVSTGLFHAERAGGTWTRRSVRTGDLTVDRRSLVVDARGVPHVSAVFRPESWEDDPEVLYFRREGSAWQTESVWAGALDTSSAIAVDTMGNVHVAFDSGGSERWGLEYAHRLDGAWQVHSVVEYDDAANIHMVLDAANNPHIVADDDYDLHSYYVH